MAFALHVLLAMHGRGARGATSYCCESSSGPEDAGAGGVRLRTMSTCGTAAVLRRGREAVALERCGVHVQRPFKNGGKLSYTRSNVPADLRGLR